MKDKIKKYFSIVQVTAENAFDKACPLIGKEAVIFDSGNHCGCNSTGYID